MMRRSPFRNFLPGFGLAGILAVCLLPASVSEVRAETICVFPGVCAECTRPEPGTICCTSPLGYTCEPDPNYRPEQGSPRASPPEPEPEEEPESTFDARTQLQIQPLHCPRGFSKVGETFYGGTRCAPAVRPRPAVVKPQPAPTPPRQVQPPAQTSKPKAGQTPPAETAPPQPVPPGRINYINDQDLSVDEGPLMMEAIRRYRERREGSTEFAVVLPLALTGAALIVTAGAVASAGAVAAGSTVAVAAAGGAALYHYWPVIKGYLW